MYKYVLIVNKLGHIDLVNRFELMVPMLIVYFKTM